MIGVANRVALTGLRPSGLPHHPAYGSVPGGARQPLAAGSAVLASQVAMGTARFRSRLVSWPAGKPGRA